MVLPRRTTNHRFMRDEFEWDARKERRNRLKHGVSFQEATTVFEDTDALTFVDERHSVIEDRFIIIGYSAAHRILVVSHTDRGQRVRIISARVASRHERRIYEQKR